MPTRNRRHLDFSLLLVLAVGLMSIQGCPTVGDITDQNLPGVSGSTKPTTAPANTISTTISDSTVDTTIETTTGDVPFSLVIPAGTLAKGKKITIECGLDPGSKVPTEKFDVAPVEDHSLILYFSLDFFGTPLNPGISQIAFQNPDPANFPQDATATLYYYNKLTKAWDETATFTSQGDMIELTDRRVSKSGTYCLFLDSTPDPSPSPSSTTSPTPTPTASPTVQSIALTGPDPAILGAQPSASASPLAPYQFQMTHTVTMSNNLTNNSLPVTYSILAPGLAGVSITSAGFISVANNASAGSFTVQATAGSVLATTSIQVMTDGAMDVVITEFGRRRRK